MALFTTNERNVGVFDVWRVQMRHSDAGAQVNIYERLGFVNEGYKLLKTPVNRCPMWVFVRTLE